MERTGRKTIAAFAHGKVMILLMIRGISCAIKPPFLFHGEEAGKDR
jgi:hypothetical protein